jgi:hypothetical protein
MGHTKNELLNLNKNGSTPKRTPKPGLFQPDTLGRRTPAKVHAPVTHLSHSPAAIERHSAPGNIARDAGRGKHVVPVQVHGGMTDRQMALRGMQHANAVAPDANPASPLAKEPPGKRIAPAPVKPGMRSRTLPHSPALGELVMQEALNGKPHWRA